MISRDRENLEMLVRLCLDPDNQVITISRGRELLGFEGRRAARS